MRPLDASFVGGLLKHFKKLGLELLEQTKWAMWRWKPLFFRAIFHKSH